MNLVKISQAHKRELLQKHWKEPGMLERITKTQATQTTNQSWTLMNTQGISF